MGFEQHEQIDIIRGYPLYTDEKKDQVILNAIYSDESEEFRSPAIPRHHDIVTIRMRVRRNMPVTIKLVVGSRHNEILMERDHSDRYFDWYVANIQCGVDVIRYHFKITYRSITFLYQRDGAHMPHDFESYAYDFRIMPGFEVPKWAQGAIQYQIFPDRFFNGNEQNDVCDNEYSYINGHAKKIDDWFALPDECDFQHFYGGDLQGILQKLDYLQTLGVEALYLNPIFTSPSSHKYDTQDYESIDPHLAIILDDEDYALSDDAFSNNNALKYIRRTTSKKNILLSNELFAQLCQELHCRGMKIILDGVFNHCGSFSRWMDKEGIYANSNEQVKGAALDPASPYRTYFKTLSENPYQYEGWWGFETLPKLNYDESPETIDAIIRIACKWAEPPYSIDGWRLDVAADLGHSEEFNHSFWKRFRKALKTVNPDLLIIAEHYGDATPWLMGNQWDSIMNYDAFMDPLTFFLTGMEKHSDACNEGRYQNGIAFMNTMKRKMAQFEWKSLLCAMNELSNHDHSRFLTRTNRTVGRINTVGSKAASVGIDKAVMRAAVVVQMSWPGAPTLYYGDEAGLVGWTDPDSRRTYPWGREDKDLIQFHRNIIQFREDAKVFRTGSLMLLEGGKGWIAYARFRDEDIYVIVVNALKKQLVLELNLENLGVEDGDLIEKAFSSFDFVPTEEHATVQDEVSEGIATFALPSTSAVIYKLNRNHRAEEI